MPWADGGQMQLQARLAASSCPWRSNASFIRQYAFRGAKSFGDLDTWAHPAASSWPGSPSEAVSGSLHKLHLSDAAKGIGGALSKHEVPERSGETLHNFLQT